MNYKEKYEAVIGVEVHIELKTRTKIFCSCKTSFGDEPNTHCCPVCMGLPGTLPRLNKHVAEFAVMAGIATNCEISECSAFDRKNYFYPDLPKAYQITQKFSPICKDGYLEITGAWGKKNVGIMQIHMEEDAGKLIHADGATLADFNRCGVPLIEVVTEPDMRSAEETVAFVKRLRETALYLGISDCRMNEGSLRCDVNLSVRKAGEEEFGTRTEMKNINSFGFISDAIEYEFERQCSILENGGKVIRETRRFDEATGKTFTLRTKEDDYDYRYFPEPDIPKLLFPKEECERIRKTMPEMPSSRRERYVREMGLSEYDAELLTAEKYVSEYFEEASKHTSYTKLLANLIISDMSGIFTDDGITSSPECLAEIAEMAGRREIGSASVKKIMQAAFEGEKEPRKYAEKNGLFQISDSVLLRPIVEEAIKENEKAASDVKNGKTAALKSLIGAVMKKTSGRANPTVVETVITEILG